MSANTMIAQMVTLGGRPIAGNDDLGVPREFNNGEPPDLDIDSDVDTPSNARPCKTPKYRVSARLHLPCIGTGHRARLFGGSGCGYPTSA
jgi:hypothetical protein